MPGEQEAEAGCRIWPTLRLRRGGSTRTSRPNSPSSSPGDATCGASAPALCPRRRSKSFSELASLAPSVGNCQPARFVRIDDETRREAVRANFEAANRQALAAYNGERAQLYASLKLAGLGEAPVHLAVFCDDATEQGHGLGARTMPETRRYSAVCALHTFWLGARAHGLGVGWVSILDPRALAETLDVPRDWSFIAYLCVGWPEEERLTPELERDGWQARTAHPVLRR